MLSAYSLLADAYDRLTDDVDYARVADVFLRLAARYGQQEPGLVLDLACGTGSLSRALADRGLDVIGADASPEMLSVAAGSLDKTGRPALFLFQRMEALDLYGTVRTVFCCLDSVNHLSGPRALARAFSRVGLFLEPGGVFVFDVITVPRMARLDKLAFVREAEGLFCTYRYRFAPKTARLQIDLDLFSETASGTYVRGSDTVAERAFSLDELDEALAAGHMTRRTVCDGFSLRPARPDSERLTVVAVRDGTPPETIRI